MKPRRIPRRYREVEERFVAGHHVRLLRNGAEAFPAMLSAIEAAERQILLEMYWFDSGKIGSRFAHALGQAARRGVEVALIYDSLGSIEADEAMFSALRRDGAHVVEFNPILPWHQRFRVEKLTRRDHRKILVVDGEIGFTGGINISDHWLPEEEGGDGWRDDMVQVEGPAVAGFVESFCSVWNEAGGAPISGQRTAVPAPGGDKHVHVLDRAVRVRRREIVRAYLYNVYRARQRIWIANSYFVPDARILRALRLASLRGVDVRVLLPGKSDVELVRLASLATYDKLLGAGVRIWEWQANVLHSKTAVIDGSWSTIGTFNLDYRSVLVNLEVNLTVRDAGFGSVMEASYLDDLDKSMEVNPAQHARRSPVTRLVSQSLYRFRSLL
jgi:cardiolipin synthase